MKPGAPKQAGPRHKGLETGILSVAASRLASELERGPLGRMRDTLKL